MKRQDFGSLFPQFGVGISIPKDFANFANPRKRLLRRALVTKVTHRAHLLEVIAALHELDQVRKKAPIPITKRPYRAEAHHRHRMIQ